MTNTKNIKIILSSLAVPVLFSFGLMAMVFLSISPFFLGLHERFTYGLAGSLIALMIIYSFLKLDHRSEPHHFLTVDPRTLKRFLAGSFSAFILAASLFLLQAGFSGLQISLTGAPVSQFAWLSLSLIPLAYMEELAFRSYPLFKLNKSFGVWVAQITMAVLFALYHYVGGWSLYASFVGPGVWSLAFGLLALKSRGIALPTGFHFGLNLALAAIGQKYWVPGLVTIDFVGTPSAAMIKSNEYVGTTLQVVVLIVLLVITHRYSQTNHGEKQSN